MALFTPTQWIQIIAALTMPLGLLAVVLSRLSKGKKFMRQLKWKHMEMAILWSVIPALVIFGLQGLFSTWVVAGGIAVTILVALYKGSTNSE